MIKLEKYVGNKTYMFPNGEIATPDIVRSKFPAIEHFAHIIETDESGEVMFAVENLSAVRSRMGISSELSESEAISKIEEIRNAPQPEPMVTPEERIAAALEFNNVLNM